MYEKIKVQQEMKGESNFQSECDICDRPKTLAVCRDCKNVTNNVRVKRTCPSHPRVLNIMDIKVCPKCKGHNLLELGVDDLEDEDLNCIQSRNTSSSRSRTSSTSSMPPVSSSTPPPPVAMNPFAQPFQLRPVQAAEAMDVKDTEFSTSREVPVTAPAAVVPNPRIHGSLGRASGRGIKRSRVNLSGFISRTPDVAAVSSPVAALSSPVSTEPAYALTPPATPCRCQRPVNYVMCASCGWVGHHLRKYLRCAVHPKDVQLSWGFVESCKECAETGDALQEYE